MIPNDGIELFSFVNFGWFAEALWFVDGTRPSYEVWVP